jgi:argininosuccinate lyase
MEQGMTQPAVRFRGRLKKRVHPVVVAHITQPYLAAGSKLAEYHYEVHDAHVLMLAERELLDKGSCATLLRGLARLRAGEPDGTPFDPETDLYMNMESRLIALVGDLGGMMHIGRSRNDLYATVTRMAVRAELLCVLEATLGLIGAALGAAAKQASTTMPGYTHWQHAQPVTVGHYLTGVSQSLLRDADRLRAAYIHTDECAMGAAALSGTSFAIDRQRVSALLGFGAVLENTYDAVAARDYLVEAGASLANLMVTLSRLCEDLTIWSTQEFGMIDIPEEFAITSSIMPQKKNPFVLEHVKGRAAQVIAAATAVPTVLKGTSFSHSREVGGESAAGIFGAFALTHGCLAMMAELLPALKFNTELMDRRAAESFCTVTDLVDLIVRRKRLPFRTAHHIVAELVNAVHEQSGTVKDITPTLIDRIARSVCGQELDLSPSDVRDALDPRRNVAAREIFGGPGPQALQAMISRQHSRRDEYQRWLASRRAALESARAERAAARDTLLAQS